jgi:N-acyl-D-aspartate/D-glutamate deacylase
MGDAAYERHATEDEVERMCTLVREAISAGAAGFSSSFSYAHRGVDGKPVPSRFADRDEVHALFLATGEAGKGVVLITPGEQCTYADVYEWQPRVGRPFTYPMFASPGGKHLEPLALHEQGLAAGAEVWPQVTPRPLTMQFTLADPYSLNTGTVFGELLQGDRAARIAAYRDPTWRAWAAADLAQSPMKPRWETFEVSESTEFPELQGRRVTDLAGERGCSPLDVMCELALAEDLSTRFRAYIANDDVDAVGHLLTHDHMALGLSDAGAHVDQLCDAPLPTDLLGTWVRDRQVMPLEQAVRKLTGEPADMFGFVRRGYLREGNWADVCVFDPQTVAPGPTRRVRDFPADGERLTAEEPEGMRHVLVNGTPIRTDETQLDSSTTRPGRRPEIA